MTIEPIKRTVYKDGMFIDADVAERLGVEGVAEIEHWSDPEEVGAAVFGLSPEQARAVRESVPSRE